MAFGPTGDATCLRLCARLSIPANARACPHIKPSRRPFRLSALCSNRVEQLQITYVPFDTQLELPESNFSYLLQDWAQSFAVENTYRRVPEALGRILDVHPSVDSLERMNQKMAETVRPFRESRPAPEPEQEGALCVVSADGKGIPIRRATPEAPIQGHDPEQEAKTNRKKMAVVGTVYTIDPLYTYA